MARKDRPPSFEEFDAKLEKLREQRSAPPARRRRRGLAAADGMQAGIEVVAGIIGGVLLGYGLDSWFGTRPLLVIVFFLLGSFAGLLNAYRHLRRAGSSAAEGGDEANGDAA